MNPMSYCACNHA